MYKPKPLLQDRIAATEVMADGLAKVGIVHDDNSAAMGGYRVTQAYLPRPMRWAATFKSGSIRTAGG